MGLVTRVVIAVLAVAFLAPLAHAWFRTPATRFATLPPGAAHPEGITVSRIPAFIPPIHGLPRH